MPASPSPALFLRIDAQGDFEYYQRRGGPESERDYELIERGELGSEAMRDIYRTVIEEGFFDLEQEYGDPDVMDGDWVEMMITAQARTHHVKTVNIAVDAFDRIVMNINSHLPDGVAIVYNALHVNRP